MALRSSPAPFLTKTYQLVDDEGSNDVVSWSDDGGTFIVWKTAEFAKELLPNYFKHNNFSSFVRQLNTYGFKKIVPEKWEFYNENFKKGQSELLFLIRRRKTSPLSPARVRQKAKPTMIPNFSQDHGTTSTSSSEPKSQSSSPGNSPSDLSGENEKLKEVIKNLNSELAETKRQCEDLMAFLTECVKVEPDEIGKVPRQGSCGSTGSAPAATVISDDDDAVDDVIEEEGGLKLFGVWLKGEKKRGREEEMGPPREEMKKMAPWMMMTVGSTLSSGDLV